MASIFVYVKGSCYMFAFWMLESLQILNHVVIFSRQYNCIFPEIMAEDNYA